MHVAQGKSVEVWLTALAVALIDPSDYSTYVCLDDTVFTLRATDDIAIVRFHDGEYHLPRRSSALAMKYATKDATLYLDGDFAAFASNDRPLPGCQKVESGERG